MEINKSEIAKDIIQKNVKLFLEAIKDQTSIDCKTIHFNKSDFPIFRPANSEFFEYSYYVDILERNIRDHLVTDTLYSLLSDDRICPDVACLVPEVKQNIIRSKYSNEAFGDDYLFSFIVQTPNDRIGYRYSSICCNEEELESLLKGFDISHVEIIDWEDTESLESEKTAWGIHHNQREKVYYTTFHRFIKNYFSEDIYSIYIQLARGAVQQANNQIGFQTIPALSLRYISDFKADFYDHLIASSLRAEQFCLFDKTGRFTVKSNDYLPEEDYDLLDFRFFQNGLCKALIGREDFARCFLTSEYLYSVFKSGNSISFDYSAIATGYFKSIELLLEKVMNIWLKDDSNHNLWIASCTFKKNNESYRKNPKTNKPQVRFNPLYKKHFKTELGPLIWLLHDNPNGWYVSEKGRSIIHDCLIQYKDECRNEHLHKDILSDFQAVHIIRNNTILCLYYLIGGCVLTGTDSEDARALSVENDSFERLYKVLLKIPRGISDFKLQFSDHIIMAFRLFNQDRPSYDDLGRIKSTIRFVIVSDYSDISFDSNEEYYQIISSKKPLIITRENIPERMWWYSSRTGFTEIQW